MTLNPLNNLTWGVSKGQLPLNASITPGRSVVLTPLVTAPATPGTYNMQWQMSKNGFPFGEKTVNVAIGVYVPGPEAAQFLSQNVPATVTAGQHFVATITFKNVGTADWPLNTALASYTPALSTRWAFDKLATGAVIPVGSTKTFTIDAVAPFVPGNYSFQFRMRDLNTNAWFGQWSAGRTVSVVAGPYAASPWAGYRGGRIRGTGRGFGSGATGVLKWTFKAIGEIAAGAVIGADGTIYVADGTGYIYALDPSTGAQKWVAHVGLGTSTAPTLGADGTIYLETNDGKLYAVDGSTGSQKWSFQAGNSTPVSSPAIAVDGTIYVGSLDTTGGSPYPSKLYALDGATGILKWSFQTGGGIWSSPVIGTDGTVYFGSEDNKVYAVDGSTGLQKWSFSTLDKILESSPAIGADGTIYIGSNDSKVYALDGSTGMQKWSFTTSRPVESSPAVGVDGTIYIASTDQYLYALNGVTGAEKWSVMIGDNYLSTPVIAADGTVYMGSGSGIFYALDGSTGEQKWSFSLPGTEIYSGAIGADGTVYFGSNNMLYAVR